MVSLIWLRPFFLWAFLPIIGVAWYFWKKPQSPQDWNKICDKTLFQFFSQKHVNRSWIWTWGSLIMSLSMFVIALAGPSMSQYQTKSARIEQANVIVMDMSPAILMDDISPNRLERSKLLIQDLLDAHHDMQWGMIVFSQMPFVVTPITSDVNHILNFLAILKPEILPIGGYSVEKAIQKAEILLKRSQYASGKIFIFSSQAPPLNYPKLANKNYQLIWIHAHSNATLNKNLRIFPVQEAANELNESLSGQQFYWDKTHLAKEKMNQAQDLGRYFLLIGMLPFIMLFRKGWFLRLWV
jgi:Ca-activated chloride channel homolog